MKITKILKAFTLAEVLVSLTIIGVISALTIPTVVNNTEVRANSALLKKALNKLDSVIEQATLDEQFGGQFECFYWRDEYVRAARNLGCYAQGKYDETGLLTGWETVCPEGVNVPGNLNGRYSDCTGFYDYMLNNLKVTKSCDKAIQQGCIPAYDGKDAVFSQKNQKNEGETDEEYLVRVKNSVKGCDAFSAEQIKTRPAFITNDGMIFIAYSKSLPIFLVDVNGKKGPNKFGYDVFSFVAKGDIGDIPSFLPGGCEYTHKGGKSTAQMLKGKY